MNVQVQLITADGQTVIDTVSVPGSGAGFPTPAVLVYEDSYFVGPAMEPHAAMPTYRLVMGYIVNVSKNSVNEQHS